MALAVHGFTLDWRRHAGSRQGIQALKAYKQLPLLQAALAARKARAASSNEHLVKPRRLRRFSISDARSRFSTSSGTSL